MKARNEISRFSKLSLAIAIASACAPQVAMADGLVLEEIIVTAQKRMENVQDVPSTVNAITSDKLDEFEVRSFSDVAQLTAGLSLQQVDARNQTVSLRGITFDPDSAASAAVEVYWNGIPMRANEAFRQMFDMQGIEILRGPQGTLQGRTSPAGSIQLYTRTANLDQVEATIQTTFSDNSGVNTQVAGNLPLIEGMLAVRVAGYYDESDGVDVKNALTGEQTSSNSSGGRISIGFSPTDEIMINLSHQYQEENSDAPEIVFGSDALGNGNPTLNYEDRRSLANGEVRARNDITALNINWAVMGHEITAISGYRDVYNYSFQDTDYGNALPDLNLDSAITSDFDIFSQELRIQSEDSENWEYLVGFFYENSQTQTVGRRASAVQLSPSADPFLFYTDSKIPIDTENYGLFTHNKHYIGDRMTFQWGVRWQKVRRFNRADITNPVGSEALIPDELDSDSSEAITGNLKLSYDITDNTMIYGSYDRGYRPGGITITPTELSSDVLLYDEETSNALELGFKSTLFNGRAQANGSVYYQKFDDYISRAADVNYNNNGQVLPITGGLNFNADAIIQGAELELTGLITESWSAFLGLSYTDANFDNAEIPCNGDITPGDEIAKCEADGQRIGGEPNWSISASSEYTVSFSEFQWFTRGLYKFTDSRANELVDNADVAGFGVFDIFTGLRDDMGTWEVSLWSKNVFDKEARTRISSNEVVGIELINTTLDSGYRRVGVIPSRTIGLTAKYFYQ